MSMPRRVTIPQMPESLKKFIMNLRDPGTAEIFECKTREELVTISNEYPLEIMSIPNRIVTSDGSAGSIIGYFMTGIALPAIWVNGPIDTVKRPVFIYYYLNASDWRELKDGIQKEVEIRKERFIKEKDQLRDIGDAS